MSERHKNIAMMIPEAAETYALVRPSLATIDNSKAKGRGGGKAARCVQRAGRAKVGGKAGSSVGRSCERAGKSVVPGRLAWAGEQWKCCPLTALQMNPDALIGGAERAARG